jgi:hypothetical protein
MEFRGSGQHRPPAQILVWQGTAGTTWLGYNDPHWLAGRHGITSEQAQVLVTLDAMLATIARETAGESGSAPQAQVTSFGGCSA